MSISNPSSASVSTLAMDADLNMGAFDITLSATQTVDGKDVSNAFLSTDLGLIKNINIIKIASDDLRHSIDAAVTEGGNSPYPYVKKKTLTFTEGYVGVIRIKFDLKASNVNETAYAILTQDGATPGGAGDLGVEQTEDSATYQTHSQDITVDLAAGNTIDLWLHTSNDATTANAENFRFYYTNETPIVTVSGAD